MSAPLRTVLVPAGGKAVRAVLCDAAEARAEESAA